METTVPDPRGLLKIGMGDDVPSDSYYSDQPRPWEPPTAKDLDLAIKDLKVISLIGRGGMAAVYRVENPDGSKSAIKLLPRELAANPLLQKRFTGEIAILTSLDHPRLIRAHRHDITGDGQPFYVMDDMPGGDLGELGQLEPKRAMQYIEQVCEGLAHLHEQGLLHRDLKPSNLLLNADSSELKIADFGLAKDNSRTISQMSLTRTGTQVGTVHYLAPELYSEGESDSVQTDLYSLGVIFYQLLTGKLPMGHFRDISEIEDVPKSADPFMRRALSSEPEARFESAGEFASEMRAAFTPTPPLSRRVFIGSGITALIGGAMAWKLTRPPEVGPLVPGVTRSPIFDRPVTRPWTSDLMWPGVSPEQMRLNHFIAGEEAHLIHFTPQTNVKSGPEVPEFPSADISSNTIFPGKSLTLESSSSLIIAGFPGEAHIDDLRLDGGTITSELVRMITPDDYPELYRALGDFSNSTGILTGTIHVLQASTMTTGRTAANHLIIRSKIIGTSPIFLAPPKQGAPVKMEGDCSEFTGGWFIQGDIDFKGPNAAGPGPITIDRGVLRSLDGCRLGPTRLLNNGFIEIAAETTFRSLFINGHPIPPGHYKKADDLKRYNLEGKSPVIVEEEFGNTTTPDVFLPRIEVTEGAPRIVTARQSGRWDRAETWDGPMPLRARHVEDKLTVPPIDYHVPDGITLNGTYDPRGLEYFGGHSLVMESGSTLEPEGNVGWLAFADLRLRGGVVNFAPRHALFARELIGGRIHIEAETLFRLPDRAILQPKDFILQGKLLGDHDIRINGDREEFIYLNATTDEFRGRWVIEEGTLAPFRNDVLRKSTVVLTGPNCWLRGYCTGSTGIRRLEISSDSRIEPKRARFHVDEMFIDGQRLPDGQYNYQSPETAHIMIAGDHKLSVGKGKKFREKS